MRESAPCKDCYDTLKLFHIKYIVYSTNQGIVKQKFNHYKPTSYSLGRKYIDNNYGEINRNNIKLTIDYDDSSSISSRESNDSDSDCSSIISYS